MLQIVTIHLYLGCLVVVAAVGFIWRYTWRRITLYLLTIQILLGAWVLKSGLKVPPIHWILALVGWALYMVANALTKRQPESRVPLMIAVLASLLVLATFGIGQHAFKTM